MLLAYLFGYTNENVMLDDINEDIKNFLLKIILPAMVAVSVKLAIISQKTRLSVLNVTTSFIIGVGIASLCGQWIMDRVSHDLIPVYIGVIAVAGDKFAQWIIFKFKADQVAITILENLISKLKK